MNLVKVSEGEAKSVRAKYRGKWKGVLTEFVESDMDVAEVKDFDCTAKGAYHSLRYVVKTHNYPVHPVIRGGRIFLIRSDS